MENLALYSKLLRMPLFIGMGNGELEKVVGTTKMNFRKVDQGRVIVEAGDKCGQILMLIAGTYQAEAKSVDGSYSVTEWETGPVLVEPSHTFGTSQLFARTYTAETTCHLISIGKQEILRLTEASMIFRINLLNLLSTALQKGERMEWGKQPDALQARIVGFFLAHCQRPAGRKLFRIKMQRLADELNDTRPNVSRALNELQRKGLLCLGRAKITIPSLERLLQQEKH